MIELQRVSDGLIVTLRCDRCRRTAYTQAVTALQPNSTDGDKLRLARGDIAPPDWQTLCPSCLASLTDSEK